MQCSCCHLECENLREYSISALDLKNRKTIHTFNLCAICRIIYMVKPLHVAARSRETVPGMPMRRRA
jgi:hypothetical protein